MRRLFLIATLLLGGRPSPPERPNFIFLLADDLRFDTLGFMGDRIVKTPNLDRLAERGVVFKNAFVTTAICAVSRASIFSGQWERRHDIADFATPFTPEAWAQTYPALLRAAGYRTGFIGKFGVGAKLDGTLFDFWRGLPGQAGEFIDPKDPARTHKTARFGNEALEFLEGDGPFCLLISFNAPHARDGRPREFEPDPRDEALYADVEIPMPPLATPEAFERLPESVRNSEARRRWARRFATPEMAQRTLRDYYRLVTGIDREVGRLVEALEKRGLAGRTVIVFTSDNGFALGDRGLADKWFMFEEDIRVPLLIVDPRAPVARRPTAMALNVDLAPTMLELAGVTVPDRMQGRSLVPFLRGETPRDWRTEFFYEHHTAANIIPQSEGVRTERWKYIRWLGGPEALYDLEADPREERDRAGDQGLDDWRARWAAHATRLK